MPSDASDPSIAVFDLGGTWFRWGRYSCSRGLLESQRVPAISYVAHPELTAEDLQLALTDFIVLRTQDIRNCGEPDLRIASISIGAPVNAHDETVLGSGPLWGPTAKPFQLQARLHERVPEVRWHVVNDITAALAPYMEEGAPIRKTLLITISTGIGCRLYDHHARRIPYDPMHGIQGEIGHLALTFDLDGRVIHRQCECGGWNHLNAFSSGRGIARILESLPRLGSIYGAAFSDLPETWMRATDEYRLQTFHTRLDEGNSAATSLLDALVTPVSRTITATVSLDPEIDRIVLTGGVAQGFGKHYRESLHRVLGRDGLYQITDRDPTYLTRRLHWEEPDSYAGLLGAGIYAAIHSHAATPARN